MSVSDCYPYYRDECTTAKLGLNDDSFYLFIYLFIFFFEIQKYLRKLKRVFLFFSFVACKLQRFKLIIRMGKK
jgi:hypothetical protein